MFKLAFLIGTLGPIAAFQVLFDQIWTLAIWANFFDRFAPGHKFAFWILIATVEILTPLGAALNDITGFAQRAVDADCVLLHVLAGGVVGTGDEFAESSKLLHQLIAATRAIFF